MIHQDTPAEGAGRRLRSQDWFQDAGRLDMTALYIERYMNYGLSRQELQSGRPIIGIAQTGSDLSPCNRHGMVIAERIREGIREQGGIAFEFPVHPIQETGKRPTAALDRNLAYLGLVETLHGYPLDGVVLITGCDKTTPACLMAAATVDLPAIVLSVGPMLNGWYRGERTGAGTIVWHARERLAAGEIDDAEFVELVASAAPSPGYCQTMGTASTMNSLAEALGMSLPGQASIPAVYRDRSRSAYDAGRRIVDMVHEDLTPSKVLTRAAFENAIVVNSAIGGSTNAPVHLTAVARHIGVDVSVQAWEEVGHRVPLIVDMQPAGRFLSEELYRAGGIPAVMGELLAAGLLHGDAMTVSGKTVAENVGSARSLDREVIRTVEEPITPDAGFVVMSGNLFDTAIMKTSVISPEFRARYLSDPEHPDEFIARAVVFEGPEDYHDRIEQAGLGVDEACVLITRGNGAVGYPGSAEVVNMQPPAELIKRGITELPCMGDGRQSGTSGSPSILNASPEAAVGGGLALVRDGDLIRISLRESRVDALVEPQEWERRQAELAESPFPVPPSQTPWQEIQRGIVAQLGDGMVLEPAVKYQRIAKTQTPRHSH